MLITLIINIIIIDFLFKLSFFTINFYIYKKNKVTNLFQYKVNSFTSSWFFTIIYISLFIVIIQLLRLYNFNKSYDLKVLYLYVNYFYTHVTTISLIYFILLFIILLFIILLFLRNVHNFFISHIYILYIYYNYKPQNLIIKENYFKRKFIDWLENLYNIDIITYYLFRLVYQVTQYFNGKNFDYRKLSKYHPYVILLYLLTTKYNKYYVWFINLLPLFVIIYDCIFNNFIIIHLYIFLVFYTPFMLLRKISIIVATRATFVIKALWTLFYDEKCGIFAISYNIKEILNFYLIVNLNNNNDILLKDGLKSDFDLPLQLETRIYYNIEFIPADKERNTYINSEGIYLRLLENGKVFQELENYDIPSDNPDEYMYLGEEWILLADKTKSIIKWNYNYDKVK